MDADHARDLVLTCLREVAPDVDTGTVTDDADLRDDLNLDSLDFLRLVELLSDRGGIRIDEDDYPRMATVGGTAALLTSTAPAG